MNNVITIFLASSDELEEDRNKFEAFINELNINWRCRDIFFKVKRWESLISAMSKKGLQDDYNKVIEECDIFLMLFYTKVGKYTEKEFEKALTKFKKENKPRIYTFFKDDYVLTSQIGPETISLINFKKKLEDLNHYTSTYNNIDNLKWLFGKQLEMLYGDPLKNIIKTDSDVINFVCSYISPNADRAILENNKLPELIKGASDFCKNVVFQLAKVNRRVNRNKDSKLMARSIPIFQALIASKPRPQQEDHKYFGQLAFALKDQEESDLENIKESFREAKFLLDQAIEIRGKWDIEYFYEFNRAICNVHLETNPDKEMILKDLKYAIPGIKYIIDELFKETDNRKLEKWLEGNNISIQKLIEDSNK